MPNRRIRRARRFPTVLGIIAAAILLIADVILIGMAVTGLQATPNTTPVDGLDLPTYPVTPSPTATSSPVQPPTRLIAAWNGQTAWRTTVGTCPAATAVVERTADAGASWSGYDLGQSGGISSALTLESFGDAASVRMIAERAGDCATSWIATYTAGAAWAAYPDRIGTAWYVRPEDRTVVYAPGGSAPAPCLRVVQVQRFSDTQAAVLCGDHAIYRTVTAGATWDRGITLPNAIALGSSPRGYLVASAGAQGCAGTSIDLLDTTASASGSQPIGCALGTGQTDDVALSEGGSTIWLWAGSRLLRSSDGGPWT